VQSDFSGFPEQYAAGVTGRGEGEKFSNSTSLPLSTLPLSGRPAAGPCLGHRLGLLALILVLPALLPDVRGVAVAVILAMTVMPLVQNSRVWLHGRAGGAAGAAEERQRGEEAGG